MSIIFCWRFISYMTMSEGDDVFIVFLADGESSRGNSENLQKRENASQKAAQVLGALIHKSLKLPDNKMDSVPLLEIIKELESIIGNLKPEIIYTHHHADLNIDHRLAHDAVLTTCRPQPGFSVKRILFWETPSSTEWQTATQHNSFIPNWYVDITKYLDRKMKALEAYDDEMRQWPHSRSYKAVKSLNQWRGASIGVEAAEAFMLGRNILGSL